MYFFLLILYLFDPPTVLCEANLQIIKKIDKTFIPLSIPDSHINFVEEKVGAHFSVLCELVFTQNETGYDEHISWFKKSNELNNNTTSVNIDSLSGKNLEDFYNSLESSELNKAERKFSPLKLSDNGSYICFTVKYKKYITLDILVRSDERISNNDHRTSFYRESKYCSESMFKCMSNGVCIFSTYVCDGKADCKDGSDETVEICNGDPCKDKLKCENGRCIPMAWCCDRHHDTNCTVTNRPKCCQILTETYEELEYGLPNLTAVQQSNTSAKYLFISVCILSILFSLVLLMLILSKVMIFAKKTALQQRHLPSDYACFYPDRPSIVMRELRSDFFSYRNGGGPSSPRSSSFRTTTVVGADHRNPIIDGADSVDPLLGEDQLRNFRRMVDRPPAYQELMGFRGGDRYLEPPPPYTSREILNDEGTLP